MDRCKCCKAPSQCLSEHVCRGEENAFAGVLQKMLVWRKLVQWQHNAVVINVVRVFIVELLAGAFGRAVWLPCSVELAPVV